MISYNEALSIVRNKYSKINYCQETENAYVFSDTRYRKTGGPVPFVIMKSDGSVYPFIWYISSE